MRVHGENEHGGDATEFCTSLTITAGSDVRFHSQRKLATLLRVLSDRETRDRLIEAAESIEAGKAAELEPAFS
ncbi:hypothetical protein VT84_09130 [Gemmata sp. SH-PL17]|uniref:hypothetical protein n=1 Tax=Gemmata sp. SH-PL17 TaxID=1630693 RepID=UPI00078E61A7|nr:hypothetical protein [Gemmata sp. SH-PL17]AMV24545.1 hypothetical protein VT84_09130 [Gemmata sp. SH-PL17]